MRLLIDTNIFIYREENHETPQNVQTLFELFGKLSASVYVHALSVEELKKNKDVNRRKVILSKINSYLKYEDYMNPMNDEGFVFAVGKPSNQNDIVDYNLLYSVFRNAFEFLITEDRKIHTKSKALNLSDRVFDVNEAVEYLRSLVLDEDLTLPVEIKYVPVANLNYEDPILDSLKNDYTGKKESTAFDCWWRKISKDGRSAWVYEKDGHLGAILILKVEDELIESTPVLPKTKRLKICTFKVTETGKKIGELFIRLSVEYAMKNSIDELYLTHFIEENDFLVPLIEEFGFYQAAKKGEEDVFCKRLHIEKGAVSPLDVSAKFYPSFYDGADVGKFIVPIRPEFHKKLFIDKNPKQLVLEGIANGIATEGNTIKKAYLCYSRISGIKEGDVLLFYRSRDVKSITAIGVVETVYENSKDAHEIIRRIGKRSVYTHSEIHGMVEKPVKVIIFRHHFLLEPVTYMVLQQNRIIHGPPQSIQKISHENYTKIKELGEMDERFTVD